MIRRFEQTDLNAVMEIWLKTNLKAHSFILDQYWYSNFDLVKKLLPKAHIMVAIDQNEVVGLIGRNQNDIAGIFVSDQMQSKGIGSQLLAEAKRNGTELHLYVYQKNQRAVSFYQREGFLIEDSVIEKATGEKEYKMTWKKENCIL